MDVYSESLLTTTTSAPKTEEQVLEGGVSGLPSADTPRNSERSSSMDMIEGSSTEAGSEYGPTSAAQMQIEASTSTKASPTGSPVAAVSAAGRSPKRHTPPMMMMPPPALGEDQQLPVRPGAEECLFYIHTGWCGYGKACRYNHPPEKMALHKPKAFNSLGLPLRENATDCAFFMRVGACKFGPTCKFNHPQKVVDDAVSNGRQPYLAQASIAMQAGSASIPPAASPQRKSRGASNSSGPSSPIAAPMSPGASYSIPAGSGYVYNHLTAMPQMSAQNLTYAAPGAHAQPYIVYYMPSNVERCWAFMTTGRCQMGHQCPYLHS